MADLQHKLDLLKRRRRRALLAAGWLRDLGEVLSTRPEPADLLSIEQTEELKAGFWERLISGPGVVRITWPEPLPQGPPPPSQVAQQVAELAPTTDFEVVLFSNADRDLGAIATSAKAVLAHASAVWSFVGEDLMLTTLTLGDGFCLEYSHVGDHADDGQELGVYELARWGRFVS